MKTKQLLSIFLTLALLLALLPLAAVPAAATADVWNGTVATAFDGGSGTEADPWEIATGTQLAYLAQQINGSSAFDNWSAGQFFKLTADLDLNGKPWTPIGNTDHYFKGTFDGGGHSINGLNVNLSGSDTLCAGLFGTISQGGTVRDLTVRGSVTAEAVNNDACSGGIAGFLANYSGKSTLLNCRSEVTVTATVSGASGSYCVDAGGVVGMINGSSPYSNSTVQGCSSSGAVTASMSGSSSFTYAYAGGIVGEIVQNGQVENCYSTGDVTVSGSGGAAYAGGVVGYASDSMSKVQYAYSTGAVEMTTGSTYTRSCVGGVVGFENNNIVAACRYLSTPTLNGIDGIGGHADGVTPPEGAAAPLTADEFKDADNIAVNFPDWDFGNIWKMGSNGPVLRSLTTYVWPGPVAAAFAGGDGSESDPYQIATADQLAYLAELVNSSTGDDNWSKGKYFALTADVDLGDEAWTPIGIDREKSKIFAGVFDGRGHSISGLYVNGNQYAGLFGCVAGAVQNLSVSGSVTGADFAGGMAGYNGGTVQNVSFSGPVTGACYVGGVAGSSQGTVQGCCHTGEVEACGTSGSNFAGGVVGGNSGGMVINCYNTGTVTASGDYSKAGGVVGSNFVGTVTNCYSTGTVTASGDYSNAGGVVGDKSGQVQYCRYLTGAGLPTGGVGGETDSPETAAKVVSGDGEGGIANPASFPGWDFENTWYMGADGPQLWAFARHVSTWSELHDALAAGDGVVMDADVTYGVGGGTNASAELAVGPGQTAALDLNGHTVDRASAWTGGDSVIKVQGSFTLTDSGTGGKLIGGFANNGGGVYVDMDAVFTMNGGTITGNRTSGNATISGGGGGVYVANRGRFTMTGGAITDNLAATGDGGGVYVGSGGTFTMTGGAITDNFVDFYGGGVYAAGTFRVSGTPVVTDNQRGTSEINNVYLPAGQTVTVAGALAPYVVGADTGTYIAVSMETPGVFTGGFTGSDAAAYFVSDDTAYHVALTGGEAQLAINRYTVTFLDEDGTTVLAAAAEYDHGTAAADIVKPADPTKAADEAYTYAFDKWSPDIAAVTADATYTATYTATPRAYTVTFVDEGGTVLQSGQVPYGDVPDYTGEAPTKADDEAYTYAFSGWTPAVTAVSGDATYKAVFTATAKQAEQQEVTGDWSYDPAPAVFRQTFETPMTFDGGTVAVSPEKAKEGDTVTMTATPGEGSRLWSLTAERADGKPLMLTSSALGEASFAMPGCKVTANAVFLPEGATPPVVLSPQKITVNGVEATVEAYNIGGTNFFRLRDLAALLKGTPSQFDVDYDEDNNAVTVTKGAAYAGDVRTEFADMSATAVASPQTVCVDGATVALTAYNIGGYNFFGLRELCAIFDYAVGYDAATNTAIIESK